MKPRRPRDNENRFLSERASTLPVRFVSSSRSKRRGHGNPRSISLRTRITSRERHSADELSSNSETDISDTSRRRDRNATEQYDHDSSHEYLYSADDLRSRSRSSTASSTTSSSSSHLPFTHSRQGRSKRSSRLHHSHSRDYSSDSNDDDYVYNFTIPGRAASLFSQDKTTLASSSSSRSKDNTAPPVSQGGFSLKPEVTYSVVKSQYSGEGFVGGEHQVDLTVTEEHKKTALSLFRWVHFQDRSMNFDHFENSIRILPGPTDAERTTALKILARVRSKFDRIHELSNRTKTYVMNPGVLREEISHTPGVKQTLPTSQTITWLCLPYFALDRYSKDTSNLGKGAHPIRTLLQTSSISADLKRNAQEATHALPGVEPGLSYHIPQLWCLLFGDSLLITCSHLAVSSLRRKAITATVTPTSGTLKGDSQRVLVYYGVSVLWSFSLDECQTWFALLTKFSQFWPIRYRLLFRDRVVSPSLWLRIVNNARGTHDNVILSLQTTGGEKLRSKGTLRQHGDILTAGDASHGNDPGIAIDDNIHSGSGTSTSPVSSKIFKLTTSSTVTEDFFVFTWLSLRDSAKSKTAFVNHEQIFRDLQAVDNFLAQETRLDESLAYQRCATSTWKAVYSALHEEADAIAKATTAGKVKNDLHRQLRHERRVDAFNAAELIVEFFLPLSSEGPTIGKFWGALAQLLQIASITGSPDGESGSGPKAKRLRSMAYELDIADVSEFSEEIENLLDMMKPFKEMLSQTPLEKRGGITIPDEFPRAWPHLIMFIVLAAKRSNEYTLHVRIAVKLISEGVKTVMLDLTHTDLLTDSVVMPQEIVSVISLQLLQDETKPDNQRDIVRVYTDHFNQMKNEIEASPLDRSHQDKILRLKREIVVIERNLESQKRVLISFGLQGSERQILQRIYEKDHYREVQSQHKSPVYSKRRNVYKKLADDKGFYEVNGGEWLSVERAMKSKRSPTDPEGYRELLNQECLDLVNRKLRSFRELSFRATDLEEWNIRRIETNKDRQDAAIYVFTIVTVIFLPLSTVAGILGMNTNDIRNMEINQWIFWAVAIPVTLTIIFLCLAWSGELDNFWRGFRYMFRTDPKLYQSHLHYDDQDYSDLQ